MERNKYICCVNNTFNLSVLLTPVNVVKDNVTKFPAVKVTGFLALSQKIIILFRISMFDSYQLEM
jgi:hypothetical protein